VWRYLAGIRPIERGWRRFLVRPAFVDGVGSIRIDQATPHGRAAVAWARDGLDARVRVDVPAGSAAQLCLGGDDEVLGPGVHERIVRLGRAPQRGPIAHRAWAAPAIAARSADVDLDRDLLRDARVLPRPGSAVEQRERLVCMPVPHAQTGAPVLYVRAHDPDARPGVRIEPARPVALDRVRFVYALVDQCECGDWSGALTLTLELHDGAIRSATGRAWPAGWNRVAVDLDDVAPGRRIVAVEIALEGTPGAEGPVPFYVGELGVSSRERAW
jgi:alpha-L-rhamnosidase